MFILSSTKHIDKIDDAALRRLGDRIDLPRLNNSDREKILQEFVTKSKLTKNISINGLKIQINLSSE